MNVVESAGAPPATPFGPEPPSATPTTPDRGHGRFLGSEWSFFGLLARGAVFLMLTLGIYRFWLTTDIRRFLWGNVEIAGDSLEYTGTARELLIGFLMAIVLLLPINGLIFLATFAPGLLKFSGLLGFVLLAILGQFAVYRARRYRLTRTVYRGVRLYQTGSAWAYALRSILWFVAMAVTLGLAYPWAVANLERYKLRHTHYGDLTGAFAGSGTRLFFRGALMWAIVIVPLTAGIVAALAAVDWETLAAALSATGQHDRLTFEEIMPSIAAGIVFLAAGGGWSILAAALLYPLFRAVTMRWWLAGLRLGPIVATSHLRNGQVYSLYLRFIGFSILFAIGAGILGGMVLGFVNAAAKTFDLSASLEIGQWGLALVAYVAAMLSYSAIYQATVMVRYWRLSFETTELDGLRAIDTVKAAGTPASAFGEGLADALNVGGL